MGSTRTACQNAGLVIQLQGLHVVQPAVKVRYKCRCVWQAEPGRCNIGFLPAVPADPPPFSSAALTSPSLITNMDIFCGREQA